MTTSNLEPKALTAVTPPTDATGLVTVAVFTRTGAKYVFPDMKKDTVKEVLPESGRIPESISFLMFYNYSGAVLSIPIRCVAEVKAEGSTLWKCPA